jgi:hypothetical protein
MCVAEACCAQHMHQLCVNAQHSVLIICSDAENMLSGFKIEIVLLIHRVC